MHDTVSDTIVARATPNGVSALAVVRMSGDRAIAIADACLSGMDLSAADSHTAHVGYVHEAGADGHLDQVVATVYRAPQSATGEDVVEISCHGGALLPGRIVRALTHAGARPARAGEFTQRAFLNGKMDLAQAESVAQLIHSSSARAGDISVEHLRGRYSELLEDIRRQLLRATALLELELDFSQEDVEFADRDQLEQLLNRAAGVLEELVESYRFGRIARDGIRVVIAGRPNAGKSTLLNALLGYERAIVSSTAGTTRDEIEAEIEVDGLRLLLVDTAGIRDTKDEIEAEGVVRSRRAARSADVIIYVVDLEEGVSAEDRAFLAELDEKPVFMVGNKLDLAGEMSEPRHPEIDLAITATTLSSEPDRLDHLLEGVLRRAVGAHGAEENHRIVLVERHQAHLRRALEATRRVSTAFETGLSGDLLVIDLRDALDELGMITGQITNEDVLDQIFSQFCIGK